jgi:hypothetical protein
VVRREAALAAGVRSTIDFDALRKDGDGDGLSDAVEERLTTDPHNPDTDGDGLGDSKDMNPLAVPGTLRERDRIRQAALERLNYWHERQPDPTLPAPLMIVVTDGDGRQEFKGYPGIVLNLSAREREAYWERFGRYGIHTQEIIITEYEDGASQAQVHAFTGHEAFLMTVRLLGKTWAATKLQSTFRVY